MLRDEIEKRRRENPGSLETKRGDVVDREDKKCKELSFCKITFASDKFDIPEADYIETIKESSHIRYKYYGTKPEFEGTIFADLRDGTIPDHTDFYADKTIEETVEYLESGYGTILFWIFWIILTAVCVYGFCYLENEWLE